MVIDYDELIEEAIEFNNKYTVVTGVVDIVGTGGLSLPDKYLEYSINDFTEESFWIISGRYELEMIKDAFMDFYPDVDRVGEYEFKAVLLYDSGDTDENGRVIQRGYLYIEHIRFNFIQSFESRERESKINLILNDNLFDI